MGIIQDTASGKFVEHPRQQPQWIVTAGIEKLFAEKQSPEFFAGWEVGE